MDRHHLYCIAALSASLYSPASAELKPLADAELATISGQAGLSINLETRIQAGEIRYSQHNNDGSERGSISLRDFDLFGSGNFDGNPGPGDDALSPRALLDLVIDDPSLRSFAVLGVDESVARDLAFLIANNGGDIGLVDANGQPISAEQARILPDAQFNALRVADPLTGLGLSTRTATLDIAQNDEGTSAIRLVLPQLSRIRETLISGVEGIDNSLVRNIVLGGVEGGLSSIPLGLEFDLAINDQSLGQFLLKNIIELDTSLFISGRSGGQSGLTLDVELGLGFESLQYQDNDQNGGTLTLESIRLGQVGERGTETNLIGLLERPTRGAALLGLTLDVETRELVDLSNGQASLRSVLAIGLPDIQNLDLTIDNIRIGDSNIGGLDILDINTLISNDTVQQLNQTFGRSFISGNDLGVDASGSSSSGYQLNGELLLSGTSDNSLQFNGQWGGQIGSLRYYDSSEGEQGQLALNNISIYRTAQDEQGNAILTPAQFQGTLSLTPNGVELGNLNAQGSIAIQSVTVGQSNLGAFLIDNFHLRNSSITISGK